MMLDSRTVDGVQVPTYTGGRQGNFAVSEAVIELMQV